MHTQENYNNLKPSTIVLRHPFGSNIAFLKIVEVLVLKHSCSELRVTFNNEMTP